MRLHERWASILVRHSARIFSRKQGMRNLRGLSYYGAMILLLVDELVACFLSLPLYVVTFSEKISSFDRPTFRIRHVLVRSILMILTAVWIVKAALVVVKISMTKYEPSIVKTLGTKEIFIHRPPIIETGLPPVLTPPLIESLDTRYRTLYRIQGRSSSDTVIHIFLEERGSGRSLLVRARADADGYWSFDPTYGGQFGLSLPEGTYLISAVSEDDYRGLRSAPSHPRLWAARSSPVDWLERYGSSSLNVVVTLGFLAAVIITLLTLV